MSTNTQIQWFADLIHEEGLDDPSAFLKAGFFDEIPFFSRYDQLPQVESAERFETDCTLIRSCLGYLEEMLSRGRPNAPLLLAITVIKERREDPIVPSILVCCGADQVQAVLAGLALIRARSSLGLYLERILKTLDSSNDYGLLQDSVTVPGQPRIFIVRRHPPYPEVIELDRLRQGLSPRLDHGRRSRQ